VWRCRWMMRERGSIEREQRDEEVEARAAGARRRP
jgi:hypothetical protein